MQEQKILEIESLNIPDDRITGEKVTRIKESKKSDRSSAGPAPSRLSIYALFVFLQNNLMQWQNFKSHIDWAHRQRAYSSLKNVVEQLLFQDHPDTSHYCKEGLKALALESKLNPLSEFEEVIEKFLTKTLKNQENNTQFHYLTYDKKPYLNCLKFTIDIPSLKLNVTDFEGLITVLTNSFLSEEAIQLKTPLLIKELIRNISDEKVLTNIFLIQENIDNLVSILISIDSITHEFKEFDEIASDFLLTLYKTYKANIFADIIEEVYAELDNTACCIKNFERRLFLFCFYSNDEFLLDHFILSDLLSREVYFSNAILDNINVSSLKKHCQFFTKYLEKTFNNIAYTQSGASLSQEIVYKLQNMFLLSIELHLFNFQHSIDIEEKKFDVKQNEIYFTLEAYPILNPATLKIKFCRNNYFYRTQESNLLRAVKIWRFIRHYPHTINFIKIFTKLDFFGAFSSIYELIGSGVVNITQKTQETAEIYWIALDNLFKSKLSFAKKYYISATAMLFFQAGYPQVYPLLNNEDHKKIKVRLDFYFPIDAKMHSSAGKDEDCKAYLILLKNLLSPGEIIYPFKDFFNSVKKTDSFWNLQISPLMLTPAMIFLMGLKDFSLINEFKSSLIRVKDNINLNLEDIYSQNIGKILLNQSMDYYSLQIFSELFHLPFANVAQSLLLLTKKKIIPDAENYFISLLKSLLKITKYIENPDILTLFDCHYSQAKKNFFLPIDEQKNFNSLMKIFSLSKYLLPLQFDLEKLLIPFYPDREFSFSNLFYTLNEYNLDLQSLFDETDYLLNHLSILFKEVNWLLQKNNHKLSDYSQLKETFSVFNVQNIIKSISDKRDLLPVYRKKMTHFLQMHTMVDNKISSKKCDCKDCSTKNLNDSINQQLSYITMLHSKFNELIQQAMTLSWRIHTPSLIRTISLLGASKYLKIFQNNIPVQIKNKNDLELLKPWITFLCDYLKRIKYLLSLQQNNSDYEKIIKSKTKKFRTSNLDISRLVIELYDFWKKINNFYFYFLKLSNMKEDNTTPFINLNNQLQGHIDNEVKISKSIQLDYFLKKITQLFTQLKIFFQENDRLLAECNKLENQIASQKKIINHYEKIFKHLPKTAALRNLKDNLQLLFRSYSQEFSDIMQEDKLNINYDNLEKLYENTRIIQNDCYRNIELLNNKIVLLESYYQKICASKRAEENSSEPSRTEVTLSSTVTPETKTTTLVLSPENKILPLPKKTTVPSVTNKIASIRFKGLGYSFFTENKSDIIIKINPVLSSQLYLSTVSLTLNSFMTNAILKKDYSKFLYNFQEIFQRFLEIKIEETDAEKIFALRCCYLHLLTSVGNFFIKISEKNSNSALYRQIEQWMGKVRNNIYHHLFFINYDFYVQQDNRELIITENELLNDALLKINYLLEKLKSCNEVIIKEYFEEKIITDNILLQLHDCKPLLNNSEFTGKILRTSKNIWNKIQTSRQRKEFLPDSFLFSTALSFHVNQLHVFYREFINYFKNCLIINPTILKEIWQECNQYRHEILSDSSYELGELFTVMMESISEKPKELTYSPSF
jgi:hypothetical protein